MLKKLSLDFRSESPSSAVITCSGALAHVHGDELKLFAEPLIEAGKKNLVFDMSDLDYVDSSGLGSLVTLRRHCLVHDCRLRVVAPAKAQTRRILEAASLGSIFEFHDSLESAMEEMRKDVGMTEYDFADAIRDVHEVMMTINERLNRIEEKIDNLSRNEPQQTR